MALTICETIVQGHSIDCLSTVTGGVAQRFILVNYNDIDRSATVVDRTATSHKVTHFQLKSGKTGYAFVGEDVKKHIGFSATLNVNEDTRNDWTHGANVKIYDMTELSLVFLRTLGLGTKIVAIVENNDIGASGVEKFSIYGFDRGLSASEINITTLEGKGTTPVVFASQTVLEPHPQLVYYQTDIATTQAAYDSLFLQPVAP